MWSVYSLASQTDFLHAQAVAETFLLTNMAGSHETILCIEQNTIMIVCVCVLLSLVSEEYRNKKVRGYDVLEELNRDVVKRSYYAFSEFEK